MHPNAKRFSDAEAAQLASQFPENNVLDYLMGAIQLALKNNTTEKQ